MRIFHVYVESGVGMAYDEGVAAWVFDLDAWGSCGQGPDEASALRELARILGRRTGAANVEVGRAVGDEIRLEVVERIHGDEGVFARDREPCTDAERRTTTTILASTRARTLELIRALPAEVLDWDDPSRRLPAYARWRTVRQLAWHVADTESRYYLPMTGLPSRERATELSIELAESERHVVACLQAMPPDAHASDPDGGAWTAVKLLRRLAWHEPGELTVMESLARKAIRALGSGSRPLATPER